MNGTVAHRGFSIRRVLFVASIAIPGLILLVLLSINALFMRAVILDHMKADASAPDVPVTAVYKVVVSPDYGRDIQPIFNEFCVTCHGAGRAEAGLKLDSYEGVMAGSKYGTVIFPNDSGKSPLINAIERGHMPPGTSLSPNRMKNLIFWVDGEAKK